MFQIQENNNIVEISSKNNVASAAINLNEGGRLFAVKANDRTIISEYKNFPYEHSSASAIMFPFVNRIQDGKYTFEGTTYQIPCNEVEKNNAIHGLLYTRKFELANKKATSNEATVTLQYKYDGTSEGFPFPFDFLLTYKLTKASLQVFMKVVNTGAKTFPFTIGWHPYFNSENLYESTISFNCKEEYTTTDDRSITDGTKPHELKMPFQLKHHAFDTAYKLIDNEIGFTTPNYKVKITGTAPTNFVQFYTPKDKSIIAIEPTVGLSNSFNNGIGLQTLSPNKTYEIAWNVAVEKC